MIGKRCSEDEIALKFDVSVNPVRRRLKLARVAPQEVHSNADLLKEEEVLSARELELVQVSDLTEEEIDEYHTIALRLAEIEDLREARRPYAEEDRAIASVVLTIAIMALWTSKRVSSGPETFRKSSPMPHQKLMVMVEAQDSTEKRRRLWPRQR